MHHENDLTGIVVYISDNVFDQRSDQSLLVTHCNERSLPSALQITYQAIKLLDINVWEGMMNRPGFTGEFLVQ
jgi:hypothetical protein